MLERKMTRVERLQYLYVVLNGLSSANEAVTDWGVHLTKRLAQNPMDSDARYWLDFIEKLHYNMNVERALELIVKEIHHEVMKPHTRQEIIENVFKEATETGEKGEKGSAEGDPPQGGSEP